MAEQEMKMDAILAAIPWRCFHCDFITSDHAEALAHFGDRDDAEEFKPICKWWASISQDEKLQVLQDTIKQLNQQYDENARQRTAIEGLARVREDYELLKKRLAEAEKALGWAIEYIADGADYAAGEPPLHDCEFESNPEKGACDFHEQFFSAIEARAALPPSEEGK